MAVFSYTCKDIQGEYHKGEVESTDAHSAAALLRRKKLIVISVKLKEESKKDILEKLINRVSFNEIVVFTRQLATMIESGLVLSEALDILSDQQINKRFKKTLESISREIKGGLDFASALDKHQDIFPRMYANLVRAGEASGKLDVVLLQLANNLEKEKEFKGKVKSAMIYPIVVVTMMIGVMTIMIFFVMPKLTDLYKQSSLDLPLPTKIILGFSTAVTEFWWGLVVVIVAMVLLVRRILKTTTGRIAFDKWLLQMPILGRIINTVILTDFTRSFALFIAAGIPILEAIKLVSDVIGNTVYKEALKQSYNGVERGLPLSNQLLGQSVFPRIVGFMVRTGEETGKMDEILNKLSTYFESEADNALKNITTLIEPVVLILLGIGVAFLVLSIILPIYKLTTNIQ